MKKLARIYAMTAAVALLLVTQNVTGQTLKPAYFGAGISSTHLNGSGVAVNKELGFQIQTGTSVSISKTNFIVAEIQFGQHRNKFENDLTVKVQTINIGLFYKVYPIKKAFLTAGPQIGFYNRPRINDEKPAGVYSGHAALTVGAGFDIKRFTVYARAARYVTNDRIFDINLQIGVNFNIL